MIYARPGEQFTAIAEGAPAGLVGVMGVRIERDDGTTHTARTVAGIVEVEADSGVYVKADLVAPSEAGTYVLLWDTGGADPVFTSEELRVTYDAPEPIGATVPSAYATAGELTNYAEDSPYVVPADPSGLLRRASADIDAILGDYELLTEGDFTGLKLDRATLTYDEDRAIARATCAQALYRLEMGEEFFHRPTPNVDEFASPPPRVGPMAKRELSGSGLMRNMTSVARRPAVPPWLSFARNIEP